jgi:hypothetical protein
LQAQSNTSGNVAIGTLNQNKCGGNSIEHGFLGSKDYWTKALSSSGIILLMLLIGAFPSKHHIGLIFKYYCNVVLR